MTRRTVSLCDDIYVDGNIQDFYEHIVKEYGPDAYLVGNDVTVSYERPETDKEYKRRMDWERRDKERRRIQKEKQENLEKALYEKLRAKYEFE